MGFGAALRHRGFLALWLGQLVSRLGDSVHEIALLWLVYVATGDPSLLGGVVAVSALATAGGSLPAGGLVDALNRKWVLVGTGLLRGAAVLAIPLVGQGRWLVPTVLAVAAITGLLEAVAGPARSALVPSLVPERDLDAANGLVELTTSVSRTLYAAGGAVVAAVGAVSAFYLDAASFAVAAALGLAVPSEAGTPDGGTGESTTLPGDVLEGLRYVRRTPLLWSVLGLSLATTLTMAPLAVVLPVFVRTTVGGGSVAFGLLYGAVYAGVAAGALLIGGFDGWIGARRGRVIVTGVAGLGVALLGMATLPPLSPAPTLTAAATLVAFGLAFAFVNAPVRTVVQTAVPDGRRGRVFAVLGAVTLPALPAGALLAGPLLEAVGPVAVLAGQGVALLLGSVPLAFSPLAAAGRSRIDPSPGL
ncbi:MAG: MFS transporter [Halobacteriales archaeon]